MVLKDEGGRMKDEVHSSSLEFKLQFVLGQFGKLKLEL
jgi:hypothetical protein